MVAAKNSPWAIKISSCSPSAEEGRKRRPLWSSFLLPLCAPFNKYFLCPAASSSLPPLCVRLSRPSVAVAIAARNYFPPWPTPLLVQQVLFLSSFSSSSSSVVAASIRRREGGSPNRRATRHRRKVARKEDEVRSFVLSRFDFVEIPN